MTQIKAVIIDDESHCIGSLKIQLAEHAPSVQVVGNAQSVPEGIDLILNTHPDLVFLDIAMPGKNGFDLLHEIPQRDFEVIFTTAYNQYALEAFKVNAADYLMKPVEPDELKRAVDKVKISIERTTDGPSQDKKNWEKLLENLKASVFDQTISLPTFEGIERIPVHRILFVEADGNYSTFWLTQEEKLVVSKTLKEIESITTEAQSVQKMISFLNHQIGSVTEMVRVANDGSCLIGEKKEVKSSIPVSEEHRCEICGRGLIRRTSQKGTPWWGCSGFPDCKERYYDRNGKPDYNGAGTKKVNAEAK